MFCSQKIYSVTDHLLNKLSELRLNIFFYFSKQEKFKKVLFVDLKISNFYLIFRLYLSDIIKYYI